MAHHIADLYWVAPCYRATHSHQRPMPRRAAPRSQLAACDDVELDQAALEALGHQRHHQRALQAAAEAAAKGQRQQCAASAAQG